MSSPQNEENQISQTEKPIQATAASTAPAAGPQPAVINAKIVSLRARPSQMAHLCFPVNGVAGQVNARIGDFVESFDRQGLTSSLLQFPSSGDPSMLNWDASHISDFLAWSQVNIGVMRGALMTVRNEEAYTALDQAINARSNAYFAKYADQPALVQAIQNTYLAPSNLSMPSLLSKSEHLANLMTCSEVQFNQLHDYVNHNYFTQNDGTEVSLSDGVVDHTYSEISTLEPEVDSTTTGSASGQVKESTKTPGYEVDQYITNQDNVFRVPGYEALAQYERAQLSLGDELFAETMRQQTVQNYQQVLTNELNSINLGVYRLQIAYLNTFLTAPIPGTVTGVYKQPGEAVRAGETVVRLELNSELYLTGTVVYPGLIQGRQPSRSGMTATIQTSLYDAGGTLTPPLTAEVLTARGGRDDDTWELVLQYTNDGVQGPVLPLDYHFDFDDTTISFA